MQQSFHARVFPRFSQVVSAILLFCVSVLIIAGCGGSPDGTSNEPGQAGQSANSNGTDGEKATPEDAPAVDGSETGTASKAPSNAKPEEEVDPGPIEIVSVEEQVNKILEAEPTRTTEGRWHLNISQNQQEVRMALVEVTKADDGSYSVKPLEFPLDGWKFQKGSADAKSVSFEFDTGEETGVFNGVLRGEAVLGTVTLDDANTIPARLTSTDEKTMNGQAIGKDFPHWDEFVAAIDSAKPNVAASKFLKYTQDHPLSPLTRMCYISLLRLAKTKSVDLSDEDVVTLTKNYALNSGLWGESRVLIAYTQAISTLLDQGYKPETMLSIISMARQELGNALNDAEEAVIFDISEAMTLMELKTDENTLKAIEIFKRIPTDSPFKQMANFRLARFAKEKADMELLNSLVKESPFDPSAIYVLGQIADEKGDKQKALEYYSLIASLPNMEALLRDTWANEGEKVPSTQLMSRDLWLQLRGSEEGFAEYLNKTYEKHIYAFAKDKPLDKKPAEEQQVVLCELFTGSSCPPCVASDIALGGVEQTIPNKDLFVALRYHYHNPTFDPLTVLDGQKRYDFYESKFAGSEGLGTPAIFLNGKMAPRYSGYIVHAPNRYTGLLKNVEEELARTTPVTIASEAKISDNKLKFNVSASNLPESKETLKLRLVLAQKMVEFPSPNGVRIHEMLVRDMPGGADGIPVADGKLAFAGTIKRGDLLQNLNDYLSMVEQSAGFQFPNRPLDVEDLYLVAFVQDDKSLEVLQTAVVAVDGNFSSDGESTKTEDMDKEAAGKGDEKDATKPMPEPKEKTETEKKAEGDKANPMVEESKTVSPKPDKLANDTTKPKGDEAKGDKSDKSASGPELKPMTSDGEPKAETSKPAAEATEKSASKPASKEAGTTAESGTAKEDDPAKE